MKKIIVTLLAFILLISLCACSNTNETEPTKLSTEDLYSQLVFHASNGEYQEGSVIGNRYPEVRAYMDGQAYYDYCQAMRAYNAGGIGEAYALFQKMPDILDAKAMTEQLADRIVNLNGYYVADNGNGSYLHVVICDGTVATEVIGYNDEDQTFAYTDSEFTYDLVSSKYDDGSEFIAIGLYNSLGQEVTVQYILTTFEDSSDIMLIKYAGYEYNTFNGVYSKVAEVG